MRLNPFTAHHAVPVKELLREAVLQLQAAKIDSASLDARLLMEYALGVSREKLLFMLEEPMAEAQEAQYRQLIYRRAARQPIAQLIGRREFYGREFKVTPDTLDPRPDSETLIEAVLKRAPDRDAPLSMLDLGTGTGCLLLTLLSEYPNARGTAVDISEAALAVAQENALAHGLSARAQFVHSNWHEQLTGSFDIVISNPPYIPAAEVPTLAPEVAQHEPKLALIGGEDGLECYRTIIAALPVLLAPGGLAVLEMGMGQLPALEALVATQPLKIDAVKQDMQGIMRCIVISHQAKGTL